MGDLRFIHSSSYSSSRALFPPAASLRICERSPFTRDQQHRGVGRIMSEPSRGLCLSSPFRKKVQWRASWNDGGLSYRFCAGEEDGPPFKKEEEELGLFDRLALAWRVVFPKRKKLVTPAEIAKQRLKMILISDRCSVNDSAKREIVNNIVGALANFVEIESQDRVRLNVSADPDLGTVYSVSVPVRRVKPEYQDTGEDARDEGFRRGETHPLIKGDFEFPNVERLDTSMASSKEGGECISSMSVKDAEG